MSRHKFLDVSAEVLVDLVRDGEHHYSVAGLPGDVKFMSMRVNHENETVTLKLESSEWPEVPEHAFAPHVTPIVTRLDFAHYATDYAIKEGIL